MAFRPEQDIRGASAFEKPVAEASYATTALNLGTGLLKAYNTRPQTTVKGPTQTERDRDEFNNLLRSAQTDLASGMSSDSVSQKYAKSLSNLGLNEQQRSVVTNTFGEDIFAVPVQADKPLDIATNLFNEQSNATKSGLIQIELDEAEEAGKPITIEEATQLAIGTFQQNTAAAQVSVIQGNRNFSKGFSSRMEILDNVSNTIQAILKVEVDGGSFDLTELAAIRSSYTMLTSQPAFLKPAGGRNADLWEQMETKKKSIDVLFDTVEKYDIENATAQGKALMANIVMNASETSPLAALAIQSPDYLNKMAAEVAPLLTKEMATHLKESPPINFNNLDLDPSVSEWYTGEGKPVASTVEDLPVPEDLEKAYSGMSDADKLKQITQESNLIKAYPSDIAGSSEGENAFTSSIVKQAYLLSTLDNQPAGASLDNLFSNSNIKIINSLDEEEGNALRAMMTKALNKSAASYGVQAAGNVQTIPDVSLNSKTGAFVFTGNDKGMQSLNAIVDRYYGGDTNALISDGLRARDRIRNRLQLSPPSVAPVLGYEALASGAEGRTISPSMENTNIGGSISNTAYDTFLASTEVLDSALWKGMVGQLNKVKNIPVRFKQFNDMANKLKVELDVIPEVIGLNPTDRAKVIETIESETPKIGIPLEDIDFDSNAEATPKEPDEEIVTTPLDSANVDFDFIKEREGYEKSMGVPTDANGIVLGKSGPTIASGFDLGQRNEVDLAGLPTDLVNKLKPYLGLTGNAAKLFVDNNNLTLTTKELNTINEFAKTKEIGKLKEAWNNSASTVSFDDLTKEQATVVASVAFQYGNLATETPKFWAYVTSGNWVAAAKELRNFGDKYPSRRKLEANYLEGK